MRKRLWRAVWRGVQRVGATRGFRAVAPKVVHHLDRATFRVTGGRRLLTDVGPARGGSAPGLPVVMLTTTGRRSGQPRSVPVAAIADGDDWLVVGSNFGQAHHPAWALNLVAEPRAVVQQRGRRHEVVAEVLDEVQRDQVWPTLTRAWPPFDGYVEAAGTAGRTLLVFRLRRAG